MKESKSWRKDGERWVCVLCINDKVTMQFWAKGNTRVDLREAEVLGWETLLGVLKGELPPEGFAKHSVQ